VDPPLQATGVGEKIEMELALPRALNMGKRDVFTMGFDELKV